MYAFKELAKKICDGYMLNETEAYELLDMQSEDLRQAALLVSKQMVPRKFDSCSIINARSGHCSENCKWCAQSAHFSTGCQNYDVVDHDECLREARHNHERGIARFSLVGSGRAVRGEAFGKVCAMLREIHDTVGIKTCASLGLLDRESLRELRRSGVTRYHCNLETAPSFFGTLCTTHTIEDKIHTIEMAREEGLEVCSGGIIGMGETPRQRVEFALTLRRINPVSIPVNVLCPIPGTPLENMPPIPEDEIIDTIAMIRLIHPKAHIRFAGGRARLSPESQVLAMRIGANGAIMGDMLTTVGSTIVDDRDLIAKAGYEF